MADSAVTLEEWWKLPPKLTISETVARAWGECVWTARLLFHGEVASVELERYDRERPRWPRAHG